MAQTGSKSQSTVIMDEPDDESSEGVDEMLATWERVQEETVETRRPLDVEDDLPYHAYLEEGTLWTRRTDTTSNKVSLTELRQDILWWWAKEDTLSAVEVEADSHESYIRRTIKDFGFVLQDPQLFEAFVVDSRVGSPWKIMTSQGEFIVGDETIAYQMALQRHANTGDVVSVVSPDGDVQSPVQTYDERWVSESDTGKADKETKAMGDNREDVKRGLGKLAPEDDLSEDIEGSIDTAIEEGPADADKIEEAFKATPEEDDTQAQDSRPDTAEDTQETSDDSQAPEEDQTVSIHPDELERVMAALHRDDQDELAQTIMSRAMGIDQ